MNLTIPCRRCGSPVNPGPQAQLLVHGNAPLALDCACGHCGMRALYRG